MISEIKENIDKLIKYNQAANAIPCEEFSDTVAGFWNYIEEQIQLLDVDSRESIYADVNDGVATRFTGKLKRFMLTVLLNHYMDGKYADMLCDDILSDVNGFDPETAIYTVHNFESFEFNNPGIVDLDKVNELYLRVLEYWRDKMSDACQAISEGIAGKMVVISTHIAGDRHAPTKTLFERVDVLGREMGYDILVMHSREMLTKPEYYPVYDCKKGTIVDEYTGLHQMTMPNGYQFPLYQPVDAMPYEHGMLQAIDLVRQFRPSKVIVMGDYSILGDVIADYVPTINMSFGFATLHPKYNQHVCLFRKITEDDYIRIDKWGIDRNKYLSGIFTFRFIPQMGKFTRSEMGISEDVFLIPIIGNRIGSDLTDDFVKMLESIDDTRWHIVFAGSPEGFDYDKTCRKYPVLKTHSTYLGYVTDILAMLECCDLYVNPPRLGGGFSVAEAFSKGIPGVSLNYGDVAAAAGSEFCVNNLDEMRLIIEKYMDDKDFYQEMSKKAIMRAQVLQNGKGALEAILDEFDRRLGK